MQDKTSYTPEEVAQIAEGYGVACRAGSNPSVNVLNYTISAVQNIPPNIRAKLFGLDSFLEKLRSDLPPKVEY